MPSVSDTPRTQVSALTGICFFRVQESIPLLDFLSQQADFSPLPLHPSGLLIHEWFEYGCIYLDGRRQREDILLQAGQLLRLHTRRKHYLRLTTPLKDRIVLDDPEFLVLDKPAGLPTHPTLDNYIDNAKILLEQELGQTLYTTHRLDVPTEGLLVIAKTPAAQKVLNKMFALGRVQKSYRAINEKRVENGPYTHYMDPESRVPKILRAEATANWWTCRLIVENSSPWKEFFWHELTLLTGKTHQIRAQFAYMDAPILGDTVYGAVEKFAGERVALECYQLSFMFRSRNFTIVRPQSLVENDR